jgi:hypothetical protein
MMTTMMMIKIMTMMMMMMMMMMMLMMIMMMVMVMMMMTMSFHTRAPHTVLLWLLPLLIPLLLLPETVRHGRSGNCMQHVQLLHIHIMFVFKG